MNELAQWAAIAGLAMLTLGRRAGTARGRLVGLLVRVGTGVDALVTWLGGKE